MGRRWVSIILGGALLVVLVLTMVRISGPSPGSTGLSGQRHREAELALDAGRIVTALGSSLPPGKGLVLEGESLRFGGQVLRVTVGPGWQALSPEDRGRLLDSLFANYTRSWQRIMKSHGVPAVSLRDGTHRVGLHTSMDRWVRPTEEALAPGSSK